HVDAYNSHGFEGTGFAAWSQGVRRESNWGVKEETHAARWGLLRGYSGNATKWVDFVVTDSTRRESCHSHRVVRNRDGVKGNSRAWNSRAASGRNPQCDTVGWNTHLA